MHFAHIMIDDEPACFWTQNLEGDRTSLLQNYDAKQFAVISEHLLEMLHGDFADRAATQIRINYGHALEAGIALLAATIQAPHCPQGWLACYQPRQLASLVEKLIKGIRIPVLMKLEKTDMYSVIQATTPEFDHPQFDFDEFVSGASAFWTRIAYDFLNKTSRGEYNALKHGLRVCHENFSFRVELTNQETSLDTSGLKTIAFGAGKHGGSFVQADRIPHSDKKRRHNYLSSRILSNWNPELLVERIRLLATLSDVLLFSLRSDNRCLKVNEHVDIPSVLALAEAWRVDDFAPSARIGVRLPEGHELCHSDTEIIAGYGWHPTTDGGNNG